MEQGRPQDPITRPGSISKPGSHFASSRIQEGREFVRSLVWQQVAVAPRIFSDPNASAALRTRWRVARPADALFLERDRRHRHDLDVWLDAERTLFDEFFAVRPKTAGRFEGEDSGAESEEFALAGLPAR